ncbi:hypothetical protein LQL77_31415 [Rhodococcus cerastii]|nr:hypothetical protein [Rhodococcus cerastii]
MATPQVSMKNWLDTARSTRDGSYVVVHFTIDLTEKSDGGWLVTGIEQTHHVRGYRPA